MRKTKTQLPAMPELPTLKIPDLMTVTIGGEALDASFRYEGDTTYFGEFDSEGNLTRGVELNQKTGGVTFVGLKKSDAIADFLAELSKVHSDRELACVLPR